ncbi:MAG: anti-sigma regulatory factor [Elainellaceae cyanobacterium]
MLAVAMRPGLGRKYGTLSFASTLHLCPVLDILLADVPSQCQPEVRLGLQEALVNAAKHGNKLDPGKAVLVQFFALNHEYWWIVSDQGSGFAPASRSVKQCCKQTPGEYGECGRGLYILHQVFDCVQWNAEGTELRLCKQLKSPVLRFA